jgi:hypothetical protein
MMCCQVLNRVATVADYSASLSLARLLSASA